MSIPLRDHVRRFWWALRGKWSADYDPNDKPPKNRRSYVEEVFHSGKNVLVEALRAWGIWNRGGKTKEDLPYQWPEDR